LAESLTNKGPNQRLEDTGLSIISSSSTELAPSRSEAAEQAEIQSAVVLARRFPRNEDEVFAKLMRSCDRTSFAEAAAYSFPRGGQTITGPSVNVAREAARVWGNIRYGLSIIRDDENRRQIEGWAWDLETNAKITAQDDFAKLVQRKKKGGGTEWVAADERDLRELTNRRGAICVRNCLLQLLPKDLIEDAITRTEATLKKGAEQDPDGARKKLILAFGEINVTPEMLETYLKHPLAQCSPSEIADLRKIFASIRDGNSNWEEYTQGGAANGNSGRTVGMPKAKEEATTSKTEGPVMATAAQLQELHDIATEKGIPPMALEEASMKLYGKVPAELTSTEFTVLLGWAKNGGEAK
jgi:hypothetical protein